VTLRTAVWDALGTVMDPELDEPITDLGFVGSFEVHDGGAVAVRLRLPTFFCAPNFTWLMVADAHDAVTAVDGVASVCVTLLDHHDDDTITEGVAAGSSFQGAFAGQADDDLEELRRQFIAKAVQGGQHRVAEPLVGGGMDPDDLAGLTLGEVPPSRALDRLRQRREQLGLPADDASHLLLHPDGSRVLAGQVPLHLRRARLQQVGIDTNAQYCSSLLQFRYPDAPPAGVPVAAGSVAQAR
jgi:metal-sulfur cluster biosynthetic enzyme